MYVIGLIELMYHQDINN